MTDDDGVSEKCPIDSIPSSPTVTDCTDRPVCHYDSVVISAARNCANSLHYETKANSIVTVHRRSFSDSTVDCSSSMPDCWSANANEIRTASAIVTLIANGTWTANET